MPRRILLVRRENIGDLILTTPLIHALRQAMPDVHLAALVNSYNAPVLAGNTDLDAVYVYQKAKHTDNFWAATRARLAQASLLWQLRRQRFDDVLLPDPCYNPRNIRLAKFVLARRPQSRVIGFEEAVGGRRAGLDVVISKANTDDLHQAEYMFLAAAAYGIPTDAARTPPAMVVPAATLPHRPSSLTIGLHISARKPSQQWPAAAFITLAKLIHQQHAAALRLFWSPGTEHDLLHPGDDAKAQEILAGLTGVPIQAMPTQSLRQLVDGMAGVDMLVCADGGALHVAAGLGRPIVALFGDSEIKRWHPFRVPYQALQKPSRDVQDIPPEEVMAALDRLIQHCVPSPPSLAQTQPV